MGGFASVTGLLAERCHQGALRRAESGVYCTAAGSCGKNSGFGGRPAVVTDHGI